MNSNTAFQMFRNHFTVPLEFHFNMVTDKSKFNFYSQISFTEAKSHIVKSVFIYMSGM